MLFKDRSIRLNSTEREAARRACRFNAEIMDHIRPHVQAGITTEALDDMVRDYTHSHGHTPTQHKYRVGELVFPKNCCTSVNEVICHGIPGPYVLQEGDIVNVDLTTTVDGWIGDQSETFLIGEVSDEARALTQCSFDGMWAAIDAIKPGCRISEIGKAIVRVAESRGFSVVRDYVGHGVGQKFHQDPTIPHYPTAESQRERLPAGVVFTIEPMINAGSRHTKADKRDGWTVRTRDGRLSAQFEHTVLMTEEGPEPMTLTQDGPQRGHIF